MSQTLQDSQPKKTKFAGGHFELSENGVFYSPPPKIHKDGNIEQPDVMWICSRLDVLAYTRNSQSEAWGRHLQWLDPDGTKHTWPAPAELLEGDGAEVRKELAHRGLIISPNRGARELLLSYIKMFQTETRARCVNQLGWHGDLFVTATEAFGSDEEKVVFQNPAALEPAFGSKGFISDWKNTIATWASGNSRAVFAISCAAAGPLLALAGAEGGGFHFRGPSSSGKTTLLYVLASFYGPPSEMVRSWRSTSNALESLGSLHNDSVLVLDELSEIDPNYAGEAAYMLANGCGKSRANRTGMARKVATWRILFVSSGEESLTALMGKTRKSPNPGQELRMADIPADAAAGMGVFEELHDHQSPAAMALALKETASKFHGTVGAEWLRFVVKDRLELANKLPELTCQFCIEYVPKDSTGQVERVGRRFGLVAAAGELLTNFGFTGWPEGMAKESGAKCFRDWLENFGGDQRENINVMRRVRLFFEQHGSSRFESMDNKDNERIINRAGFWRSKSDDVREYLMMPNVFRDEVCSGIDHRYASKVLKEAGWIIPDNERGRIAKNVRLPGIGKTRCYVFGPKIWEESSYEIDLSKIKPPTKLAGTSGNSGSTIEDTELITVPHLEKKWEQVGTGSPKNAKTMTNVPTSETEWVHPEALKPLTDPTCPIGPTPKLIEDVESSKTEDWNHNRDKIMSRFRDWLWHHFQHGADNAQFDAQSREAAEELKDFLKNLTWPDFEVEAVNGVLCLRRVCERYFPRKVDGDLPELKK